ncbi:MAG: VanZ family protein [Phycisphaerales bacterium]|nr:VanZ family protein [Phycisphaerales bacterium]
MKPRTLFRVVWILYALALLTATHWPGLAVPKGPISRMDLVIHAIAFAGWTLLLFFTAWITPGCTTRRIIWTAVVAIIFAAFDELTQPLFTRTADWTDYAADSAGIVLMSLLLLAWTSVADRGKNTRSEGL